MGIKNSPIILLCGGASKRMGTLKGLLDYNGKPWLLQQLDTLSKCGAGEIITVLGHNHAAYKKEITALSSHTIVLTNPHPEYGPFSSLMYGVKHLKENTPPEYLFVLPIDVPAPDKNIWQKLYDVITEKGIKASVPQYNGKGGHPVCMSFSFLKTLMEIPPDSPDARLDTQISQLPQEEIHHITVDDMSITRNLNTLEEWQEYL